MPKTVRITKTAIDLLDSSNEVITFTMDGVSYVLTRDKELSVPDIVANRWSADNSNVEIIYPTGR